MKIINTNKKAKFLYFLEDEFTAGIELKGSEVKSIREGGISLDQSYVTIDANNEVYLLNCFIKPYSNTASFGVDERRKRKLLLRKPEINKLIKHIKIKGGTVVPTKVFISPKGLVTAKGKKQYDKNQASKDASREKEVKRILKNSNFA